MGLSTAGQAVMLDEMQKKKAKNAAAVALGKRRAKLAAPGEMSEVGKLGASIGGQTRAANMSASRRKQIAKKAAEARWGKKK